MSQTAAASTGSTKMTVMMPDGVGFVERLEVFGDDLTVVNAARVSFAKESHEFTTNDGKLVKYLASARWLSQTTACLDVSDHC